MEPILAKIIDLPCVRDPRGNLSFIQNADQIPFEIARAYWIYDVPGGHNRDGHAFHTQQELIVSFQAVSTQCSTTATATASATT